MRGIVIAGTHSGCGKTTVTLGIMAALGKRGLGIQPFKAGPDFIDAGLHGTATGRKSRNLDQWMCGRDYVRDCFTRHARAADIAVIEGVMGLYDGDCSTAGLAGLLNVPVVLVVDAYGMAESAGALVYGFTEGGRLKAESEITFAGVIFNRVASEHHYARLKDSVRDVPVLGYLPRELDFEIPHRHLGLTIAEENPLARKNLDRLADTVLQHIDIDAVIRSARITEKELQGEGARNAKRPGLFRLAVAHDKAFSFYYEDNLDMLRDAGAEIVRFSPLADQEIPRDIDAVYIGGGYPELHAERLSRNVTMMQSIGAWAEAGKPLYAECGGLMYLSKGIRDCKDRFFGMAGVFPFETRMTRKPRLGYRHVTLHEDCILGNAGDQYRGHEFHYSEISDDEATGSGGGARGGIYSSTDSKDRPSNARGYLYKNTLASYVHVHFGSNPGLAQHFAGCIRGEIAR